MKHTFLALFAGCGALTAASFGGSHTQNAHGLAQVAPARAQAPVAVVISPDGSRAVTQCVAVACCDPKCDPKKARAVGATPSVVRVSTNGNGQVLVCGGGGGTLSVACGNGQGACGSTSVASTNGSALVAVGQGRGGAAAVSRPSMVGSVGYAAQGSGSSCQASAGPLTCTQGAPSACVAGQGVGSCSSSGASAGGTGQLHGNVLSLVHAQSPAPVAQGSVSAQTVDLGHLVQTLRGTNGSLVAQDPPCQDSEGTARIVEPEGVEELEMIELPDMPDVPDMPEVADAPDMPDVAEAWQGGDFDLGSNEWKAQVESALELARASIAGADDETREALEEARAEVERAQSGALSEEAMRDYESALERAEVEMKAAQEGAARAQWQADGYGTLGGLARAQDERARAQDERREVEKRAKQEAKRARADAQRAQDEQERVRTEGRGRSSFGWSGDAGLEARVQALEKIARGRGQQVSGGGSLEKRVAELERAMRSGGGQGGGDAKAAKVRSFYEVSPGVKLEMPKMPRLQLAQPGMPKATKPPKEPKEPKMPKSVFKLATPATPGTPATPPTAEPFGRKMRVGTMGRSPAGMDENTRRDLERAMGDLRKEADRLREEMMKLRGEIEALPKR